MTTSRKIIIAIILIALPVVARLLFFYRLPYSNPNIPKSAFGQSAVADPPTPSSKVTIAASAPNGKIVLIDSAHGNLFDPSEIEPLVTDISARGATVEFDNGSKPLASKLKYASAYIVFAPSQIFSADDVRSIQQFVDSGGRLLVFADPTRTLTLYDFFGSPTNIPDVNYSNPLVAPFGLTFVNDYIYNLEKNEGNFRNVKFTDFADTKLTKDLQMVVFYGAHSIHTENGTALTSGDEKTLSSLTDHGDGLSPLALSSNGQVLAAGDFSFLINPFNQVADNSILLAHIADFAVDGERKPMLVNFPYLFQRPVTLLATGKLQLVPEGLGPVSALQKSLKEVNIPINIRDKALDGEDLIVIGTLDAIDDLAPFIKPFKLSLDTETDSIEIAGVGKVSNTGSGILLFNHGPKSNILTLLAPEPKDLPILISLVASGDLSSCVLQDNIGVCGLSTSSASEGSNYYDEATATPVDETTGTSTPEPTPTVVK